MLNRRLYHHGFLAEKNLIATCIPVEMCCQRRLSDSRYHTANRLSLPALPLFSVLDRFTFMYRQDRQQRPPCPSCGHCAGLQGAKQEDSPIRTNPPGALRGPLRGASVSPLPEQRASFSW